MRVREIVVSAESKQSYDISGEIYTASPYARSIGIKKRLLDHINLLAGIAKHYHQEDGSRTDQITRLTLPAFSLHTRHPFTLAGFSAFMSEINACAKRYPQNVHLLLPSFNVITREGKLLHVNLRVECGENPKIHTSYQAQQNIPHKKTSDQSKKIHKFYILPRRKPTK